MRTGIILAAGFGSRLAAQNSDSIKPLTPVGGRPLMLRTLDSLALAGCDRMIVVVGHRGDLVRSEVEAAYHGPAEVSFVTNPRYELSNGLSVLAAAPLVPGDFVLTMADHVFGDEIMQIARACTPPPGGATLFVDQNLGSIFDMDDATKVRTAAGQIVAIGKHLDNFDAVDTGLFVCSPGLFSALRDELDHRGDASMSDGMTRLAAVGKAAVRDIGNGRWQDVDTPEMLAHAETIFAPEALRP